MDNNDPARRHAIHLRGKIPPQDACPLSAILPAEKPEVLNHTEDRLFQLLFILKGLVWLERESLPPDLLRSEHFRSTGSDSECLENDPNRYEK